MSMTADDLSKLKEMAALKDSGVLSEEEFQAQKAALMAKPESAAAVVKASSENANTNSVGNTNIVVNVPQMTVPVVAIAAPKKAENEWGNTFGCHEDVLGCCYVSCCGCFALCEIGDAMGNHPIGPKKEAASAFTGCCGQFVNSLTYTYSGLGALCGLCCCPEKTCCAYDANILRGYAEFMGKKTSSPPPCGDPCMQMFCCRPCTVCLMYRELKLVPCSGPRTESTAATEAPTFVEMGRA